MSVYVKTTVTTTLTCDGCGKKIKRGNVPGGRVVEIGKSQGWTRSGCKAARDDWCPRCTRRRVKK